MNSRHANQVRLLGSIDVVVNGVPKVIPGVRRNAVLAALALDARNTVSVESMIDIVWGDNSPNTAINTIQRHVSYLRKALGLSNAITARSAGYVIDLGNESTDIQAAEQMIIKAKSLTDRSQSAALFQSAISLWRGRPLADLAGIPWFDAHAQRLDRIRRSAEQSLVEARLALGEHAQLVPELEYAVARHPFDEEVRGYFMLALYRSGRQADALATFQQLRQRLSEELGIEPSRGIRELYTAILRQDDGLGLSQQKPQLLGQLASAVTSEVIPPALLPPVTNNFVGRAYELESLERLLLASINQTMHSPVTVAITGPAGVGKTTTAVHWARTAISQFPDGQLYVDLRGFDRPKAAIAPEEAARLLLDAVGVEARLIPAEAQSQLNLLRSVLSKKRIVLILDNARDAQQVRPLLPGSAGCFTLVTSRADLTSLVVGEGAVALPLDTLSRSEARELLTASLGQRAIEADPDAVETIVRRCAGLPLALAVMAARAMGPRAAKPRV